MLTIIKNSSSCTKLFFQTTFSHHFFAINKVTKRPCPNNNLDWSRKGKDGLRADQHVVENHGLFRLDKPIQGVFYRDPILEVNQAWYMIKLLGIKPITHGSRDIYIVKRAHAGYAGGYRTQNTTYHYITLVTESKTNKLVTA